MTLIEYGKKLSSILALATGLSFTSSCKLVGEEGNGYDGGNMPPPEEQCLSPEEFKETTIYSSTTICPGTYRNVSLRVSADDVTLRGENVTLDGLLAGTTAITAENLARLVIEGFHLKDYAVGVRLEVITDSTVKLQSYSSLTDGTALSLSQGLAVVVQGGTLEGTIHCYGSSNEVREVQGKDLVGQPSYEYPSAGLKITGNIFSGNIEIYGLSGGVITGNEVGGEISMSGSNNVLVENNTIRGDVIQEGGNALTTRMNIIEGAIQLPGNSLIENNTITGGGIIGAYAGNLVIRGNTITGGVDIGTGNNVTVENNSIQNGGTGIRASIYQGNSSSGLNILSNTIRYHSEVGVFLEASNSLVEENTITDNVKKGIIAGGCNNIVRNNDLRNNGEGNELHSEYCSNTYEGNLE